MAAESRPFNLSFAGEVNIEYALLSTPGLIAQNITNQIVSINIFEDIFSPFISGNIIVKESLSYSNLLSLSGQEGIEIKISTPKIESKFIMIKALVYKMSDREVLGDKSVTYTLHFVSRESMIDMNKKISKMFDGNIGDLVNHFCRDKIDGMETTQELIWERTSNNKKFVANFWSPIQCINYLKDEAVNANGTPSYVFFQNRDGFYFITLEQLYSSDVYTTFIHDKYVRDELEDGFSRKNIARDYQRILDINMEVGYNYIDRLKNGFFGSSMHKFDIITKKYLKMDYSLLSDDNVVMLNDNLPVSRLGIYRTRSVHMPYITMAGQFDGGGDESNFAIIQKRISLLARARSNVVNITVPGRVDYTAGQKVYLNIPSYDVIHKSQPESDTEDSRWSGNYLISSINHYINRNRHECRIELITDSLKRNLDD